jgi:hypothetical protein
LEERQVAWLVTSCGPEVAWALARSWVVPPTVAIWKVPVTETYWAAATGADDGDDGEDEEPPQAPAPRTQAPPRATIRKRATTEARRAITAASLRSV